MKSTGLVILAVLMAATSAAGDGTTTQEPETTTAPVESLMDDVIVHKGENATFTCDFDFGDGEVTDYEVVWQAASKSVSGVPQRLLKFVASSVDDPLIYTNTLTYGRTFIAQGNVFTILDARLADNELLHKISCVVESGTRSQTHTAIYTVVSFADSPAAQLSNSKGIYGVSDRSQIIGECNSGFAYPEPKVDFYKNGLLIEKDNKTEADAEGFFGFESDGYIEEGDDGQINVQRDLFMMLTEDDDRSVISCKVTTTFEEMSKTVEANMGVIRIEHPVSRVNITTSVAGPYEDGQEVPFQCVHNGYPDSYVMTFGLEGKGPSDSEITLTMDASMNGKALSCKATLGDQMPVTNSVYLTVNYNNNVKVTGGSEVEHGGSISLECSSESNPDATYTWKKDGSVIEGSMGDTYTIAVADFTHAGSYSCVASNYKDTESPAHTLSVNGLVLKSAAMTKVGTEKVEDGITMTCSAESPATPTFAWTKSAKEGGSEAVTFSETLTKSTGTHGMMHSETVTIKEVNSDYSMMEFSCTVSLGDRSHTSKFEIGEITHPPPPPPTTTTTRVSTPKAATTTTTRVSTPKAATTTSTQVSTPKAATDEEEVDTTGEIKESGGPAGIIVAILVILLIIVVIIGVLYYKGIICKKEGKSGDETADDIEVEIRKDDDIESGAVEGEKLLENGDN